MRTIDAGLDEASSAVGWLAQKIRLTSDSAH
jgi:hypothetical protein